MFHRIVALTAGAEIMPRAVQRAALCASPQTQIVLLDAVYEPALDGFLGDPNVHEKLRARVLAEHLDQVQVLAEGLEQRGLEAIAKVVWASRREDAAAEFARRELTDLVVATPLDDSSGALSGRDWHLLVTTPAPVLIVRGPSDRQYRNIVAAVDPFHAHAKPADLDRRILAAARELQVQTRATLTVVHCFTPPEFFREDARLAPRDDEIEASRREVLANLLRASGIPPAAMRVLPGAPHDVLETMALRGEADVIVMGAVARGRLKDWLIGSTADRVLGRTRVDVLAVNPAR